MIARDMDLVEVAATVCSALEEVGIQAVLCGGSAATYYAGHAYQSADIDFVVDLSSAEGGTRVMAELGYREDGGVYRHHNNPYEVEFVPWPPEVGGRRVESWNTEIVGNLMLKVISATDCAKDRLAHFIHWRDGTALDQAVAVATSNPVNIHEIREWCEGEGGLEQFEAFRKRLGT